MRKYKISFAGAGNVAGALCRELHNQQNTIEYIVTRSKSTGSSLARSCNASWSDDYLFPDTTEVIIVSIPDHNLSEVLEKIRCNKSAMVLHTAGSIGIDVFPSYFEHYGVLYPLQTFSKGRKPDLSKVPFFIEASDETSLNILRDISSSISDTVYVSDSGHRRMLHLAAVFTCNFVNHLLTTGKDISKMAGFPFEVLKPLITETINKAIDLGPENSQTGPAFRGDINTIEKHIGLLSFSPGMQRIYELLSESITDYYQTK